MMLKILTTVVAVLSVLCVGLGVSRIAEGITPTLASVSTYQLRCDISLRPYKDIDNLVMGRVICIKNQCTCYLEFPIEVYKKSEGK